MSASDPDSTVDHTAADQPSTGRGGRTALLVLIGVVVVAGTAFSIIRSQRSVVREAELAGTITYLDPATRSGSIEVVNEDGSVFDLTGTIPEGCPISIDGNEATLADLQEGDEVRVKGRVERVADASDGGKKRRIVAEWIRVQR